MRWWLGLLRLLACGGIFTESAHGGHCQEIPFELNGGLIFMTVESPQAKAPLHFILDSGAGVSVLSLRTVQELGLTLAEPAVVRGVGSATGGFWPQHLTAFAGSMALPTNYLAVDLAQLSAACATHVDGLIGADFFQQSVVQIDYKARRIRISEGLPSPALLEALPLKKTGQSLLTKVQVQAGKRDWLRVDTGCASALEWVDSSKKFSGGRKEIAVGLSPIVKSEASLNVVLGRLRFENVLTGIHSARIFRGEMGLVGNGLLSRFKSVTFDAPGGHLYVEPYPGQPVR